jgi:hypothetical protein
MQRLFSSFPRGRVGIALLLLRIGLSVALIKSAAWSEESLGWHWASAALGLAVLLLWLGLWMPAVAGLCLAFDAAAFVLIGSPIQSAHACVALLAVALALIGPGAYSLDAILYGRRLIVLPPDSEG